MLRWKHAIVLGVAAAWLAPAALDARPNGRRHTYAWARVEKLCVEISPSGDGWEAEIEYEIEVRGAHRDNPVRVVLCAYQFAEPLRDPDGHPIFRVVSLDNPKEVKTKSGKMEFAHKLCIQILPEWREVLRDVPHVRVGARVEEINTGALLAYKSVPVDFDD
jgi:hypothetical protein